MTGTQLPLRSGLFINSNVEVLKSMREQYSTANHRFAPASVARKSSSAKAARSALVPLNLIPAARRHPLAAVLYDTSKRGFDLAVATSIVLAILPLLVMIAVAVKLTSRGPVFFRHKRLGRGGIEFDCLKFRTMVSNAEDLLKTDPQLKKQFDEKFKIDDDPRITKVGRFLRSTSLDELPQLIQIIQGKMSLIGPRPIIEREREKYSIYVGKLLSVRPGLSGLWQVSGRSETTYAQRVLLDMYYIDNRSLLMDLKIFIKTFGVVLKRTGAC